MDGFAALSVHKPMELPNFELFGEPMGGGEAARSAPGELPTIGLPGDEEQAGMSRDDVGEDGDGSAAFANAAAAQVPRLLATPEALTNPILGLPEEVLGPRPRGEQSADGEPSPDLPALAQPAQPNVAVLDPPADQQADQPAPPAPPATGGATGGATGDPLPKGDYELDPFTKKGSYVISMGNMRARTGRAVVRSVRPRFLLAAKVDLSTMAPVEVESKVRIDAHGKVIWTDVIKSNGTENINQPIRVALYAWEFEPSIPGEPLPEEFTVTITIR